MSIMVQSTYEISSSDYRMEMAEPGSHNGAPDALKQLPLISFEKLAIWRTAIV